MSSSASAILTVELWWLAIGAVVWALVFSHLPYGPVSRSAAVIVTVGTIVAWPVALGAAIAAYACRGRS